VPWGEKLSSPEDVIKEITDVYAISVHQVGQPEARRYGRVAYTISVKFGECALDLSFFPNIVGGEADAFADFGVKGDGGEWKLEDGGE
jgi:hypothetical protein